MSEHVVNAERFFEGWLPPEKSFSCPPDIELVSIAKGAGDPSTARHIENCEQCQTILERLRESATNPGARLEQFLALARQRAEELTKADKHSPVADMWAYFTMNWSRKIGASLALAAAAVLALVFLVPDASRFYSRPDGQITVQFEGNPTIERYERALALMRKAEVQLNSEADPSKIRNQVDEINSVLRETNLAALDENQRSTLLHTRSEVQRALFSSTGGQRLASQVARASLVSVYHSYDQSGSIPGSEKLDVVPSEKKDVISESLTVSDPSKEIVLRNTIEEYARYSAVPVEWTREGTVVMSFGPGSGAPPK